MAGTAEVPKPLAANQPATLIALEVTGVETVRQVHATVVDDEQSGSLDSPDPGNVGPQMLGHLVAGGGERTVLREPDEDEVLLAGAAGAVDGLGEALGSAGTTRRAAL